MKRQFIDLTGRQFGQWSVKERGPNSPTGAARWWCVCTCGAEKLIDGMPLRNGNSTGCGCLQFQKARRTAKARGTVAFVPENFSVQKSQMGARKAAAAVRAKRVPISLAPLAWKDKA